MKIEKIQLPFIKKMSEEGGLLDTKPVYHYTSPDTFLSIIKNGTLRFSDVMFMNDNSEAKYFIKKLIEFCEKQEEKYPKFCSVTNELLKDNNYDDIKNLSLEEIKYTEDTIIPYKPSRGFIFCACEDCDALNMWNYYIHNGKYQGYSIGININKFLETFETEELVTKQFIVYCGKVLYDEKSQFSEIQNLAEEIEKMISKDEYYVHEAIMTIRSYIDLQGLFYKSPKFKTEKEYRMLISIEEEYIPRDEKNEKELVLEGFSVKHGLIIPHLEVKLPHDCIVAVHTAPMMEFPVVKKGIKELLNNEGYTYSGKSVAVNKSAIPIRY